LIILIVFGEKYKLWSSSLRSFLQSSGTSPLLGQNILLNTLFSNTLSPCSSLNVRDQVSHPYRIIIIIRNESSDGHVWLMESAHRRDHNAEFCTWHDGRHYPCGTRIPPGNWASWPTPGFGAGLRGMNDTVLHWLMDAVFSRGPCRDVTCRAS
jgi:hypothetical protein